MSKADAAATPTVAENVFVLGSVRSAAVVRYSAGLRLGEAISAVGGWSEFSETPIYIIRDGAVFLETTTRHVPAKKLPEDPLLKPKDVIYVGRIEHTP